MAAVVDTALTPDRTVGYVYSRSSVGVGHEAVIRGLAPAEENYHLDLVQDAAAVHREHVAARRSRAKRSAGGGFLLPYRRPATGLQRRSAAEPINDTGAVASSLRPARPFSAAAQTIALNRPRAARTGARIAGQESYWEQSRRRPYSAQTAQQRAAADAARKGCRPGVALSPSTRSLGGSAPAQAPSNRRRPRPAQSRVRRRPVSASATGASLRVQQAQAQAQAQQPWCKMTYEPTNDPVGLLAKPIKETVSGYNIGHYAEPRGAHAALTWGRLLRCWWAMCDVGPLLRAEGLVPPPPMTPPIELSQRTIQQLDEQSDIGAGRRFCLAVAENRLVLARAMLQSDGGTSSDLVARVAVQIPSAMLSRVHRECAGGEIPSCEAVKSKARAVSLLSNADRSQMIRASERAGSIKNAGPSTRVAATSSCLVILMAIEKYGVGPSADDALASNDNWVHIRQIFDSDGTGKIGDGWQAASRVLLKLSTTNSRRLMRAEPPLRTNGLPARLSTGEAKRERRVWLHRSVVACLAPILTSPEFLVEDDPSANVFGGWPVVARWLTAWFAYVVHPDDLDVLFEWRQCHQNAAFSRAVAATLDCEPAVAVETPTPGWATTYLNPPGSNCNEPASGGASTKTWMLDTSATLALMAFLEPAEMFSLAQSSTVLWRWLRDPTELTPVWAVANRAHAAAARALARRHRRLPRAERQLQQERACVRLESLCSAAPENPITLRLLLAHCSPGGNGLYSTPSAYTRHRSLSPRLEFAVEAYYMMWQADPAPTAASQGTAGLSAAASPSLWYKPASRYGSQLCSNWEAAAALLLSHATATGPLSVLRNSRDNSMSLSVDGVLSLLEKLPEHVDRASLPERLLPWTSVMMRPEWACATVETDAAEVDRLAIALGQVVVAADCAARIATGAVTEEVDIVEQLGVCRMRRFTELALFERL